MFGLGNAGLAKGDIEKWRFTTNDAFVRAQHNAISRLIPVLYFVVSITVISLAISNAYSAPFWMSVGLPFAMFVPIFLRLRYWLSVRNKAELLPIGQINRDIRQTKIIGPLIALVFTGIGIGLLYHGAAYEQGIAAIFIWILAITSAFCLAAIPMASNAIALCVALPLVISFAMSGNHLVQTMAGIVALVTAQVVYILRQNYRSFFDMVYSKSELLRRKEEAEKAEIEASALANTDHLTGLPNRRRFELELAEEYKKQKQSGQSLAVGILDLDGFKPVNDVYGHSIGDEVLMQVATRLAHHMEGVGRIARMGGDEFAFIISGFASQETLTETALIIQNALSETYHIDANRTVRISSSIGLAILSSDRVNKLRLIDQADIALYHSKSCGRAAVTIFRDDMEAVAMERAKIEQGLRRAIQSDELEVFYQPIYQLSNNRLAGFEALARWNDVELGAVSPSVFIPIAEQSGLIGPLTELLLRKAAVAAATWPQDLFLSFNISAEQLVRESAGLRIMALIAESGMHPSRLEVEVTETALMRDIVVASRTIENLKSAGVRISLDDFGTGYSSLSQIRTLPLDKVKIDKSFIDEICTDTKTCSLVATIVDMCNALNLRCVAEGVENQNQIDLLRQLGCHSGQGYKFSKPLSLTDALALIESEEAGRRTSGKLQLAS